MKRSMLSPACAIFVETSVTGWDEAYCSLGTGWSPTRQPCPPARGVWGCEINKVGERGRRVCEKETRKEGETTVKECVVCRRNIPSIIASQSWQIQKIAIASPGGTPMSFAAVLPDPAALIRTAIEKPTSASE